MGITKEITPREAALKLGIRLDALYPLLWAGQIAARKLDGRWCVSAAAVARRLRSTRRRRSE
jgi:hypothetical protein